MKFQNIWVFTNKHFVFFSAYKFLFAFFLFLGRIHSHISSFKFNIVFPKIPSYLRVCVFLLNLNTTHQLLGEIAIRNKHTLLWLIIACLWLIQSWTMLLNFFWNISWIGKDINLEKKQLYDPFKQMGHKHYRWGWSVNLILQNIQSSIISEWRRWGLIWFMTGWIFMFQL